ncbi:MAG: hypothetical protein KTR24_03370 [Saprospiraceae bacterium]|nr:hypothetical protein [Saprospiraceae bacterium]
MKTSSKTASITEARSFIKDQEPIVHSSYGAKVIRPKYATMQIAVAAIADPCEFSAIKNFYGLQ